MRVTARKLILTTVLIAAALTANAQSSLDVSAAQTQAAMAMQGAGEAMKQSQQALQIARQMQREQIIRAAQDAAESAAQAAAQKCVEKGIDKSAAFDAIQQAAQWAADSITGRRRYDPRHLTLPMLQAMAYEDAKNDHFLMRVDDSIQRAAQAAYRAYLTEMELTAYEASLTPEQKTLDALTSPQDRQEHAKIYAERAAKQREEQEAAERAQKEAEQAQNLEREVAEQAAGQAKEHAQEQQRLAKMTPEQIKAEQDRKKEARRKDLERFDESCGSVKD